MEHFFLILGFIFSIVLGLIIGYYWQKSISKNNEINNKQNDLLLENNYNQKIENLEKINQQKNIGLENTISDLKSYQSKLESVIENLTLEKNELALKLARKETDFNNFWQRNKEQKEEVEKLQEKFTK